LEARILQLADAFAAMTIQRVYSAKLDLEEALEIIHKEDGHQFDPELAERFIRMKTTKNSGQK
jgi:HD-GYP domain-containing protein (c-di-GMP phosphodiesterase class II)